MIMLLEKEQFSSCEGLDRWDHHTTAPEKARESLGELWLGSPSPKVSQVGLNIRYGLPLRFPEAYTLSVPREQIGLLQTEVEVSSWQDAKRDLSYLSPGYDLQKALLQDAPSKNLPLSQNQGFASVSATVKMRLDVPGCRGTGPPPSFCMHWDHVAVLVFCRLQSNVSGSFWEMTQKPR